jgi:hypothetical protein
MSLKKYLLYVKTTKGTKVLTKVFYNDTELSTYVENQYQECSYTYRQI